MTKYSYLPLLLLLNFCHLSAQIQILNEDERSSLKNISTSDFPYSVKSLTDIPEALNLVFDEITSASTATGFNAAVLLPDGTLWERASGIAEALPDTVAMETKSHMGIGSISKTFVSATLLRMMEDGLLTLDDSIGQYIDEYPNIDGSATIRQLLSHRTGFNDYINENPAMIEALNNNLDSIWNLDTLLHNYVLEPNFEVDAGWSYSNTNYLLAGKIIEKVSGRKWYEEVRSRIIEPLKLNNTFAYPWESWSSFTQANAFDDIDGDGMVDDVQGLGITLDGFFSLASSAGCLVSLPKDLVYFMNALFGTNFLLESTLDEMKQDYAMDSQLGFEYGLGQFTFAWNLQNNGHNGSLLYQSTAIYYEDYDLTIAVQQNQNLRDLDEITINDVRRALLIQYIECQTVSATNDLSSLNTFQVFPNPTKDLITISIQNESEIERPIQMCLINSNGETVQRNRIYSNNTQVDMAGNPQGLYYLNLGNSFRKIIVE